MANLSRRKDFVKLLFLRLFMLLSFVVTFSACSSSPDSAKVSDSAKARLPWPQEDGTYALQIIELTGLNNLYELWGQFAKFYISPGLAGGHLTGQKPKARFLKIDDYFVPEDELSQQIATVYAHMQHFAQLDLELGVGSVNKWPRDVGVGVKIPGGMNNNAFYDGETDSMLFVPYTSSELPLAVNAGVLAHEHFHSLFFKLVTVPLRASGKIASRLSLSAHSQEEIYKLFNFADSPTHVGSTVSTDARTAYHLYVMRGLNEGLADFWGWVYTGNPDFIADSLPAAKKARTLTVDGSEGGVYLDSVSKIQNVVTVLSNTSPEKATQNLVSASYVLGTEFSRIFKAYADQYATNRNINSIEARKEVAKIILKALPILKEDFSNLAATDLYDPVNFLKAFMSQAGEVYENECELVAVILNANNSNSDFSFSCVANKNQTAWTLQKKDLTAEKNKKDQKEQK